MILRRLSLVAAIVIALGGASAFAEASGSFLPRNLAQNSTNLPPQRRPQSGWLQELNLTSQQIQQIKTIRSQSQNQIKPKRQAVQQAQQELHDLLAGKTSTEQVRTKYNQLKILRQQLADTQFENTLAIREILSLEQRQKFADHLYKPQRNSSNRPSK
ncbi:Spy/CpxP family protein refolding chaperone [Nostoc sp. NMS4]|uniref:Spy/CpxP family protein refolding chaperone n=1 Tax=Nostoc sp. NMS4 TaxID=2815390 RepID=UPI0025FBC609|nr:Spy/CpxP family protein refolding chaperone [Nostoc sp. NMS4]MBN3926399.1 Spy/CpxP family protein refolding chaperone [Nostoc sp. NMS4]